MLNVCLIIQICVAECEWYGQLYCSGDIIIDLYRSHFKIHMKHAHNSQEYKHCSWKFLKKCVDGKMGIYGRTWQEVAEDPRFRVMRIHYDNITDITQHLSTSRCNETIIPLFL